jgi:hypothetical protein
MFIIEGNTVVAENQKTARAPSTAQENGVDSTTIGAAVEQPFQGR